MSTSSGAMWLKFESVTVALVIEPTSPLTEISEGYGAATPVPTTLIVPEFVPTKMFHPPVTDPTLFPESSTTNSFHAPLATVPFNDDSVRPVGGPPGAGA